MKNFIISSFLILLSFTSKSQCFQIESILVDACDGGNEGQNEMVTFKVGNANLSAPTLTVNWPANTWRGLTQDATTASQLAAINASITGCGFLREPVAGVLKANSRVLLVTGTNWNPLAQSFVNLNDTLTVLFQTYNLGNTGGHFANYTVTPTPSNRTLTMTFTTVPNCTDTVTYNRNNLTKQNQAIGAQDGGAVEFTSAGVATYVNHGCQAPYIPLSVDAGLNQIICSGFSSALTASVNGIYNAITWSGGLGTFSSLTTLTTSYTPAISELGTSIKLYVTATNNCPPKTSFTKDSVYITYLQSPSTPTIGSTNGYSLCPLASTVLSYTISNASTTGTIGTSWSSPAASTSTYAVSAPSGTVPVTYTLSLTNFCGVTTKTVNVYPLASPSVTISAPTLTACAGNTVAVMATSNSGNFSWNNPSGATTSSVVLTANTTTTGVVTTTNSCGSKTDTYTLTVTPQPTVSISPTAVSLCTGQSATVTASANTAVTYTWNGTGVTGLNTNTVSLNTAGNYTASASNVCNTSTAQVNVVVNSSPSLSVASTSTLLCGGTTATLSLSGSTGTYSWSTGATTPTIAVTLGGTYTATVTTAACGFTNNSIAIATLPTPTLSVNSNSVTICAGQTATLTATSNITPYQWSTGATTNTISVSPIVNTTYTVGVSNACGSPTQTINVSISPVPSLSIAATSLTVCNGIVDTLSLSGSSGGYTWSGSSATTQTLSINSGGVYTATVNAGVCGTATASIMIVDMHTPTLTVTSNTAIVCNNTPIILTATSTYTNNYSWLPLAASTNTLQVLTPLVYTVTSTNSCGSDTQTITVTSGSKPSLTVTPTSTVVCPGNTTSITVTGGAGNYNWTGVSSTNSVVSVSSGTYIVSNTNACGTGSQTVTVNTSTVTAGLDGTPLTGTQPLIVSFTNLSTGATTYTWNYGNGTTTNGSTPVSQTYTAAGTYTVLLSVTNANGCTNSQSILITVTNEPAVLVIPNVFTPNGDNVNDVFYVKATNMKDFNCVIFDRWGLQLYSWSDVKGGWDGKTGGKDVTDGTYFYIINATDLDSKDVKRQGAITLLR